MTSRVREIIEMNLVDHCIPLLLKSQEKLFPMYYGRFIGEAKLAFPVTEATGIDSALEHPSEATALAVDREAGFEAYVVNGRAALIHEGTEGDELVVEMKNEVVGFPIHGAVVFSIDSVQLIPPP